LTMAKQKIIITGASGILGSAVRLAFSSKLDEYDLLNLSFSQAKDGFVQLDLTDTKATEIKFTEFQPNWIIHCAAERRPDVAEKDPQGTKQLNEQVPAHLTAVAKSLNATLIYISTDYVFDGANPPYKPSSQTNPLQLYGQTKLGGERAALSVDNAQVVVVRVPVLYGPAPRNSDTAVNILVDVVSDQSGKQYKMDHYATRYPTNVEDIGKFLVRLTKASNPIPKILHYSAAEPFTKYEMCLIFSKILGLPHAHVIPDAEPPTGAGATTRPRNCQLDTSETDEFLEGSGLDVCIFEEWWSDYLSRKQ